MDSAVVKKWGIFFGSIVIAILIADRLALILVGLTGLTGPAYLVVNFVVYALLFFGVLYVIQKVFHVDFFGFYRE